MSVAQRLLQSLGNQDRVPTRCRPILLRATIICASLRTTGTRCSLAAIPSRSGHRQLAAYNSIRRPTTSPRTAVTPQLLSRELEEAPAQLLLFSLPTMRRPLPDRT